MAADMNDSEFRCHQVNYSNNWNGEKNYHCYYSNDKTQL